MVDFSPGRGSEQSGLRPAVVLQNDVGNRHAATTIVAAITSTIKAYPVTVVLKRGDGGVRQPSMINLAQILTVDKARLRERLGALPPERIGEVDEAITVSLGLA
jgi:mRNA interferase MazF